MSSSNNVTQVIIDLNKILNLNDSSGIKRMETEFESSGWRFISLPAELIPPSTFTKQLVSFIENDNGKLRYKQYREIYGYSKLKHKEGSKLLTGSYFEDFANKGLVPKTVIEPLNELSQILDAVTKRLVEILDQHCVFQLEPSLFTLIDHADLPLRDGHFGMLDIVSYFNDKSGFQPPPNGQSTEEVNCVPHYDPGLLSISILSTHQRLHLKNLTNNQWIDGPLDRKIGVIWLGEAASRITQNRLKSGIHRVIYPQEAKCRVTIWYEVCTTEQLRGLSEEKKNEEMAGGIVTFANVSESAEITVLPGEKKTGFFETSRNLTWIVDEQIASASL